MWDLMTISIRKNALRMLFDLDRWLLSSRLLYGLNSAHLDSAAPPFRKPNDFRRMMDNTVYKLSTRAEK
jgi:hypothetical protein